jgi:hypothetical protein
MVTSARTQITIKWTSALAAPLPVAISVNQTSTAANRLRRSLSSDNTLSDQKSSKEMESVDDLTLEV